MFCRNCGAKLKDGARFCASCGTPVFQEERRVNIPEVRTPEGRRGTLNTEREKVFHADKNSGIVSLALMIGLALAAIFMFYQYSDLPQYFYEEERRRYFLLGILFAVLAIESGLLWFAKSKVQLCVGKDSVSGVSTRMFISVKFEYEYSEITEVASILGTLQIRVHGKWLVIPGIENRELAKEMIEERIAGNR